METVGVNMFIKNINTPTVKDQQKVLQQQKWHKHI